MSQIMVMGKLIKNPNKKEQELKDMKLKVELIFSKDKIEEPDIVNIVKDLEKLGYQVDKIFYEPKSAEPPAEEPKPDFMLYRIKWGDNLTRIAKRFGTTIETICKDNSIKNPNIIIAGKLLKIRRK